MTEIGFYHLTRSTLAQALPQLLTRTLAAGQRALVLGSNAAGLEALSTTLWAQPGWLPHGLASDGDPDLQPIWLSTDAERRPLPVHGRWRRNRSYQGLRPGFRSVRRQHPGDRGCCSGAMEERQGCGSQLGLLATDRKPLAEKGLTVARAIGFGGMIHPTPGFQALGSNTIASCRSISCSATTSPVRVPPRRARAGGHGVRRPRQLRVRP
jgi:hypothetical protein